MKGLLVFLGIIVAMALLAGGCAVSGYNTVVSMDEKVKSSWAQVDTQLQRRFDLIPNLVETVKGVAGQEEKVFLGIAKARESYFKATTINDKAAAANEVQSALARLLVLQETYPALRSSESFQKLQDSIEGTENRLAVARKDYNDAAEQLNAYIRRFPGQIYAGFAGVTAATYFKPDEAAKTAPKVDFSDKSTTPATAPAAETPPAADAPKKE